MLISSCAPKEHNAENKPKEDNIVQKEDEINRFKNKIQPQTSENRDYNFKPNKIYYTEKAVVLTYHHISSKPVSSITISPKRFEEDLKMLKESGFNVISLRDMIKGIEGNFKIPPNAVVITFDDGYESFYKHAFPLLKKYNMPAVNFVITSWTESYSPSGFELNSLSPDEIKEMYKSGIVDIQSHSHNGHYYIIKDEKGQKGGALAYRIYDTKTGKYESEESYNKRVFDDLKESRLIIGKYIGTEPDTLCFPFGHFNQKLVQLGQQAGFKYFVTTLYGSNKENSKSILIKRIRSGDAKLTTEQLKLNIIDCAQGKPATP